ncbi:hypothetical protein SESBI_28287 [Sesbania bispinosa]|nr:hypothetical protein SESBI_28287 [Sesbania bispinosa]
MCPISRIQRKYNNASSKYPLYANPKTIQLNAKTFGCSIFGNKSLADFKSEELAYIPTSLELKEKMSMFIPLVSNIA